MKLPPPEVIEAHVLSLPQVKVGVEEVARLVESECVSLAYQRAFDGGQFAAGIRQVPSELIGWATVRATDPKSRWLEEGTGIYGPRRTPIVPVKGKFLVFRLPAGSPTPAPLAGISGQRTAGDLIFARSVKGRPGSYVMRDGSKAVAERLGLLWLDLTR